MNHPRFAFWKFLAVIPLMVVFSAETCQTTTVDRPSQPPVVVADRSNAANVGPGQIGSATASCNPGETMLSGGYGVTTRDYGDAIQRLPDDLYYVYADYPSGPSAWTASLYNRTRDDTAFLVAHIECAANLTTFSSIASGVGAPRTSVHATCPSAGLTGGGYQITGITGWYQVVEVTAAVAFEGQSSAGEWSVSTTPEDLAQYGPGLQVHSYAVCSSLTVSLGPAVGVTAPHGNVPPYIPTSGQGHAACGPGELLTGAAWLGDGIAGASPISGFFPAYDASPASWGATVWSVPVQGVEGWYEDAQTVKVTPLCATV